MVRNKPATLRPKELQVFLQRRKNYAVSYFFTSIEICEGEVIVSHLEKVYSQYETECREMSFRAATSTIP